VVQSSIGPSTVFSHLVKSDKESVQQRDIEEGTTMLDLVITLLEVSVEDFSWDVPFTAYGLDSISAAKMSFTLRPFVDISQLQLLSDITFKDLAIRLEEQSEPQSADSYPTTLGSLSSGANAAIQDMEAMVAKYSSNFLEDNINLSLRAYSEETILLIGSTGALGTSILAQLVKMTTVTRIYAVNRPDPRGASLKDRQAMSLRQRGYDATVLESGKVVCVEGRLETPGFGISPDTFNEVGRFSRGM
jgi:hypothetical protein